MIAPCCRYTHCRAKGHSPPPRTDDAARFCAILVDLDSFVSQEAQRPLCMTQSWCRELTAACACQPSCWGHTLDSLTYMMLLYTSASSRRYGSVRNTSSNRRSASSNSAHTRDHVAHASGLATLHVGHEPQRRHYSPRREYWHLERRPSAKVEVGKWGCTSAVSVVHASRGLSPSRCAYATNTRDTQCLGSEAEASCRVQGTGRQPGAVYSELHVQACAAY